MTHFQYRVRKNLKLGFCLYEDLDVALKQRRDLAGGHQPQPFPVSLDRPTEQRVAGPMGKPYSYETRG
jgi:hypothetical protein